MAANQRLPFYNPLEPTQPKIWPDYRLLMPVCAVANIGQLACDLIISTLLSRHECRLIGRIYSPALMSVVGPNAYSLKGPPSSSTEVYESRKHKLIIIQQRTSYFKDLKRLYCDELVKWIKESQFRQVFVLTSSFAQCNPDTATLGRPDTSSIRSVTTSLFEPDSLWLAQNIKPLPSKHTIKVVQDGLTFLPGSGITKPLIKAFEKAFVPAAFLIDFCSEGINIHDCYEVVNAVGKLLQFSAAAATTNPERDNKQAGDAGQTSAAWVEPLSWTQAQC